MTENTHQSRDVSRRAINLLLIAVIAIAIIGFFVGLDYGVPQHDTAAPKPVFVVETDASLSAVAAMSYSDIGNQPLRRGRTYSSTQLSRPQQDLLEEIVLNSEFKRASLQQRSERRAYNGAPPIIPHSVDQLSSDSCMLCHGEGFKLENRTAKQLPHPYLANCMQCHAPPTPNAFSTDDPFRSNSFDGVSAPFEGDRAWTGAPPVVPHSTWMRDNCLACHGPSAWPGMETTHPWRQNCLQCHAPSSALDMRPPTLNRTDFLDAPRVVE